MGAQTSKQLDQKFFERYQGNATFADAITVYQETGEISLPLKGLYFEPNVGEVLSSDEPDFTAFASQSGISPHAQALIVAQTA